MQTRVGPVRLSVPRDRAGTFEPVLVPKRAERIAGGLDDMIISLSAHGMSVRDILHHLRQVNGTELSHEQVSRITDQVMDEVKAWQTRPLDPTWAVVFLDAIVVKVRDNHVVQNKHPTRPQKPAGTSPPTTPWSSYSGWPSSTSRTNAPANAPSNATTATSTPSHPHASSRDNAPPDGAKHSTNSPRPIQDASGKADFTVCLQGLPHLKWLRMRCVNHWRSGRMMCQAPEGVTQMSRPGQIWKSFQSGRCLSLWWRLHRGARLQRQVMPGCQGTVWSRSQRCEGWLQVGKTQVACRASTSRRIRAGGRYPGRP